jgi:hypothetical protein
VAKAPLPSQARRIDAVICVTVVLPLLPVTRQLFERALRVLDDEAGHARLGQTALRQRRHRAARLGLGQHVMAIEALALERDEQVARLQRARVAVHACDGQRTVADERRVGEHRVRLGQRHHRAPPRSISPCVASTTSEKGWRTPATS